MSAPGGAANVSIRDGPAGALIKVAARPGTRDGVLGVQGDALKLGCSAAPERGQANRALVEVLATLLGVRKSAVALASGDTAREKVFLVEGLAASAVRSAVEKALAGLRSR